MGLLTASVGARPAANHSADVKAVQILLNFSLPQLTRQHVFDLGLPGGMRAQVRTESFHTAVFDLGCPGGGRLTRRPAPLPVTGRIDNDTTAAIVAFQNQIVKAAKPDGIVSSRGATLDKLVANVQPAFTPEVLQLIYIKASPALVERYYLYLATGMQANGIATPLRMAHFLAQLGHESSELRLTEELASGAAYEGRADLGNTEKGDGVRFKGRGLIQITGRANYTDYGKARGRDFLTNPSELASDPAIAVDSALWFWNRHHLNPLADADNINAITRKINGGTNGLEDRKQKLARAKLLLMR